MNEQLPGIAAKFDPHQCYNHPNYEQMFWMKNLQSSNGAGLILKLLCFWKKKFKYLSSKFIFCENKHWFTSLEAIFSLFWCENGFCLCLCAWHLKSKEWTITGRKIQSIQLLYKKACRLIYGLYLVLTFIVAMVRVSAMSYVCSFQCLHLPTNSWTYRNSNDFKTISLNWIKQNIFIAVTETFSKIPSILRIRSFN